VAPLRGQIMVTEKLEHFLDYPTITVRQTAEGSVMLGDSAENVGFDDGATTSMMADIARRAILAFPMLRDVQIVRAWGSLRVMTPDGLPVYEESEQWPGSFVINSHSGVTLAAVHAEILAPWIAGGDRPELMEPFHAGRFAV
jgi:glycine/D-amino acid oxidase-like deaminating enzyme